MSTQYITLLFYPVKDNLYYALLARPLSVLGFLFLIVAINLPIAWHQYAQLQVQGIQTDLTQEYIVELTNKEREAVGVAPLSINPLLTAAAQQKAEHMVSTGNFEHYYQDGQQTITPWQFLQVVGYEYENAGENLGKDFVSAEKLVTAWVESPAHRDNLLSPNYTEIGVAVFQGPYLDKQNSSLVVQMLAKPLGEGVIAVINEQSIDNFSTAPVLIAQPSLSRQLVGMYPKAILVFTLLIIGLVGFAVVVDQSRGKKLRKEFQLSKELWYH